MVGHLDAILVKCDRQKVDYDHVFQYIVNNTYPDGVNNNKKRLIRHHANDCCVNGEKLYRKCDDVEIIRDAKSQQLIIKRAHEGFNENSNPSVAMGGQTDTILKTKDTLSGFPFFYIFVQPII